MSTLPLLIDSLGIQTMEDYRRRIQTELPTWTTDDPQYEIKFSLKDDSPADYTRAIQEIEILKTELRAGSQKLPSFMAVWNNPRSGLAKEIRESPDPQEAKWQLSRKYGYKIATTFMPMYAKAIYDYFEPVSVLDPCAGWGDRMVGALASKTVRRYVGFDPNRNLVDGYVRIQTDFGNTVSTRTSNTVDFTGEKGEYTIHSCPFERSTCDEEFDFAFTSPPFFDYEDYSPENPKYKNWYVEFYEPLFRITEARLKSGAFFAIHIGDTSAGKILDFLQGRVGQITSFELRGKIGLVGGKSGKDRTVYLFQKTG